ncbi:hypothetical protein CRYUN_Cryun03dG0126900 [Craigia yunnanensis]
MEGQRVVVIQDASKEVCSSAIRWVLHGLFLKPGDLLVLLGVLHEVNDPRTLSFKGTRKLLGYRSKVDSSSKFGANPSIVDGEAAKEEYEKNAEIMEISKLCKAEKVEFRIEVAAGASPSVVAMKSVENLKATWVILDRKIKKNKKIFLEKLSCGISRMKRNNSIKLLRGPRTNFCVTYDDMMPGAPEEEDLFSIELFPTYCFSEKTGYSSSYNFDNYVVGQAEVNQVSQNQKHAHTSNSANSSIRLQAEETFGNPACIICDNRIQNVEWRKDFTYVELHAATDGFSSKNNLSGDGVESTFREGSHRLLVYEYVCNGSLNQHLSKCLPMPLSWTERLKIALGASRGLNHLHQNNIIHKDIRPSNILLNHDFEPLLGDFGLATMRSDQYFQTSKYLAPEYPGNGTLSTQTDVYSFGVVLVELITGQRTMEKMGQKGFFTWARALLKQRRYLELVDPIIANSRDVFQLYRMAQLAKICLSKNLKKRLPMDKVVSTLEYIIESKASCLNEDHRPLKSYLPYNSVKTFEQECCYEDVDVTSPMRSRSFTASVWTCRTDGKSYKFMRASTRSTSQVHYGEMLN